MQRPFPNGRAALLANARMFHVKHSASRRSARRADHTAPIRTHGFPRERRGTGHRPQPDHVAVVIQHRSCSTHRGEEGDVGALAREPKAELRQAQRIQRGPGRHVRGLVISLMSAAYFFAAPMRQIVVPQSGHLPLVMGLPFFVVPSTGSVMIFLALHFTQYASIAMAAKTPRCSVVEQDTLSCISRIRALDTRTCCLVYGKAHARFLPSFGTVIYSSTTP